MCASASGGAHIGGLIRFLAQGERRWDDDPIPKLPTARVVRWHATAELAATLGPSEHGLPQECRVTRFDLAKLTPHERGIWHGAFGLGFADGFDGSGFDESENGAQWACTHGLAISQLWSHVPTVRDFAVAALRRFRQRWDDHGGWPPRMVRSWIKRNGSSRLKTALSRREDMFGKFLREMVRHHALDLTAVKMDSLDILKVALHDRDTDPLLGPAWAAAEALVEAGMLTEYGYCRVRLRGSRKELGAMVCPFGATGWALVRLLDDAERIDLTAAFR